MSDGFGPIRWFDWDSVQRHQGTNLPHFEMPGAIYFVTFWLHDSLPADVYEKLAAQRDAFLAQNPPPHTTRQELEFKRIYSLVLERMLDGGHGQCPLRSPEARKALQRVLLRLDGQRYQLGDFVIMPNHLHLLARMHPNWDMRTQCRNWKTVSERQINSLLGLDGRFWQSEPFDHIVRSPKKLRQCQQYIRNNPRRLPASDYTLAQGIGFGLPSPISASPNHA